MTIEGLEKCKFCGQNAMMFYESSTNREQFGAGFCFSCGSKYERTSRKKTSIVLGKGVIHFFDKDNDMSDMFEVGMDTYSVSDMPIDFDVASATELIQMLTQEEMNRLHSVTVFHAGDPSVSEFVNPDLPEGMYFRYSISGVPIPV